MYNFPIRQEKRLTKLYQLAEHGEFRLEGVILYEPEIKNLRNKGFEVFGIKEFPSGKNLYSYSCTVSWEKAYGDSIPHIVYSYIHHIIETFPKGFADSFAKELYIIARRAQLSKV